MPWHSPPVAPGRWQQAQIMGVVLSRHYKCGRRGQGRLSRGTTNPPSCPNWAPTWARAVGGPRGPAPRRNHAFHPLGFSRVVEAEEGGLTQAQHTAFRERKCLQWQAGLKQPPPTSRLAPGPKSHPHLHSQCPHRPCLTPTCAEKGTGGQEHRASGKSTGV